MAVRGGINGFGRIGRLVMRAAIEAGRDDIEFVGINDLGDTKSNAHLLKYDTVHGRLANEITTGDDWIDDASNLIGVLEPLGDCVPADVYSSAEIVAALMAALA